MNRINIMDDLDKDLALLNGKKTKRNENLDNTISELERDLKALKMKRKEVKKTLNNKGIFDYLHKDLKGMNPDIYNLPIKYGRKNVIQIKVKAPYMNNYSRKKIKTTGNELSKKLKEEGFNGLITSTLRFNEYWHSGRQTEIGNDIKLYDPGEDGFSGTAPDQTIIPQGSFSQFIFYIMPLNRIGFTSKYNDCLYIAIQSILKDKNIRL